MIFSIFSRLVRTLIFSIFRVDHMVSILWVIRYFGCRYFGSFDTLGVDTLGWSREFSSMCDPDIFIGKIGN